MKKNILIILAMCFCGVSYAQRNEHTVSGYVKDVATKEPLIGVLIATIDNHGTITNEYGFYSFNLDSKKTNLVYSHIGYKDSIKELELNADTTINILLFSSTIKLEEVVVHSKPLKFSSVKKYGSVNVNSEQLKYVPSFLGEQDILKYFQLQPGVSAGKEGSSGLNLRGGSSDQTLILMDDIPIYNQSHAFGFVSIFSGDFIKSAELFKGYTPPNYGGRLSGVAALNIREGDRVKHSQSLQLGTTTISALAEGPINKGKGSYIVGGRYFIPGVFLDLTRLVYDNDGQTLPQISFYDITAKASYDLGTKNTLYLNFYTGRDIFGFSLNENSIDDDKDHKLRSKSNLGWGNIVGSIRLSSQLSNKIFLNTTAYYSHLSNQNKFDYIEKDATEERIINSNTKSRMDEFGVKMFFQQNVNSWYKLSYGLNFASQYFIPQQILSNNNGFESEKNYGDKNLLTGSLFLDNKFNLGKFEINVGGRLSIYNNNFENKVVIEPRISTSYNMSNSSLWLSFNKNTQPLFSMSQQINTMPVDYWIPFHDADALPSSMQASIGYKHDFDFGLDIFVEVYAKRSENISLIYNNDDFLLGDGGYEMAQGNSYGVEFMVQYRKGRFNFMGSYTYSNSKYDVNGKEVLFMYDTPHNLNVFAAYDVLRKQGKKHTFSINLSYKTGLPYILSNEAYPEADTDSYDNWFYSITNNPLYANSRLINFFRLDLNYTMEKKLKRGSRVWQISLLNATAHQNPYVVYNTSEGYKAFCLIPILPSFSYKRYF